MKKLDTYLSLCKEVYGLSKPNPPEDAYAFYRDYVTRANGSILEPFGFSINWQNDSFEGVNAE